VQRDAPNQVLGGELVGNEKGANVFLGERGRQRQKREGFGKSISRRNSVLKGNGYFVA